MTPPDSCYSGCKDGWWGIAGRYGTIGTPNGTGVGVTIYVVDTGIRTTHHEFSSAATDARRATFGYDQ